MKAINLENRQWLIEGVLRKGHVKMMRLRHEKSGMTAEELAEQYRPLNLTARFIQSILDYRRFPND